MNRADAIEAAKIEQAKRLLTERAVDGRVSGATAHIQRKLNLGYNKGAAILEALVAEGFITEADSNGKRTILARPPDQSETKPVVAPETYLAEREELLAENKRLREALRSIIKMNDEFRGTLPDDWESDPLNELCDNLRHLVADHGLRDVLGAALQEST